MDHIDPICPFDASQYIGTPDAEPVGRTIPVRERIARPRSVSSIFRRVSSRSKISVEEEISKLSRMARSRPAKGWCATILCLLFR